jgi:hypothetical protein
VIFVIKEPTAAAFLSGEFSLSDCFPFAAAKKNLIGHEFKDDREVETVGTMADSTR